MTCGEPNLWNGNRYGRSFTVIRGPEIRTKQSVIRREPETNYARTAQTAENLTRTRSMADGSIDPLLQFKHRAGTDVLDRGCTRAVWKAV